MEQSGQTATSKAVKDVNLYSQQPVKMFVNDAIRIKLCSL